MLGPAASPHTARSADEPLAVVEHVVDDVVETGDSLAVSTTLPSTLVFWLDLGHRPSVFFVFFDTQEGVRSTALALMEGTTSFHLLFTNTAGCDLLTLH